MGINGVQGVTCRGFLHTMLFEVNATDPATFAAVAVVLAGRRVSELPPRTPQHAYRSHGDESDGVTLGRAVRGSSKPVAGPPRARSTSLAALG